MIAIITRLLICQKYYLGAKKLTHTEIALNNLKTWVLENLEFLNKISEVPIQASNTDLYNHLSSNRPIYKSILLDMHLLAVSRANMSDRLGLCK